MNVNTLITPAFSKEDIQNMFSNDRIYKAGKSQKTIFVTIDPAAGGQGSKFAIISCFYEDHKMVVKIFFFYLFKILCISFTNI
jgi:hypothetical protein